MFKFPVTLMVGKTIMLQVEIEKFLQSDFDIAPEASYLQFAKNLLFYSNAANNLTTLT